jgi:hypothetical protein
MGADEGRSSTRMRTNGTRMAANPFRKRNPTHHERNEEGQVTDLTLPDPVPDQALLEFFLPSRKAVMDSSGRKKPLICSFAGTAPKAVR